MIKLVLPGHKTVDHDLVGLTDPVGPGEGLDVVVGVPVAVVDDDGVGRCQVDTQTTGPEKKKLIITLQCFVMFRFCRSTFSSLTDSLSHKLTNVR